MPPLAGPSSHSKAKAATDTYLIWWMAAGTSRSTVTFRRPCGLPPQNSTFLPAERSASALDLRRRFLGTCEEWGHEQRKACLLQSRTEFMHVACFEFQLNWAGHRCTLTHALSPAPRAANPLAVVGTGDLHRLRLWESVRLLVGVTWSTNMILSQLHISQSDQVFSREARILWRV